MAGLVLGAVALGALAQGQAGAAAADSYADRAVIAIPEAKMVGEATVKCRAGYHATGGGFVLATDGVYASASGPAFDNGDPQPRGWRAQLRRNAGASTINLKTAGYVNVVCAKDS
ncbi:hypothetical protein [Kitasatospora sp. NPDC094011]|uniref:hypothetical protein n=1 Tax=Kitasatospora sp. NPDC094011 TaxID=3364090 RepID=UPI0037F5EBD7